MSLGHGASIPRNGLVFYYDMENIGKSFKGKPTTNLTTDTPSQNGWAGSYTLIDSTTKTFDVETRQFDITQATSAWRSWYWDVSSYVGQTVTISGDVEFVSETNASFQDISIGQGNTGPFPFHIAGSDLSDRVRISTKPVQKIHMTWSGVINATGVVGFTQWINNVTVNNGNSILRISKVQIEASEFETPFVNGTRSDTQALLDLTNNNTITANSLTYNSDGTFEFNGSSDYASVGNLGTFGGITVEVWFNYDNTSNYKNTVDCNYTTGGSNTGNIGPRMECNFGNINWVWSGNTSNNNVYNNLPTVYSISTGTWYHTAFTWQNSSTFAAYTNGVNNGYTSDSLNGNNGAWTNVVNDLVIGRGFTLDSLLNRSMDGKIGSVKIYNRALTENEIKQNFEATRGRYGI